jgi:hypothetical protein
MGAWEARGTYGVFQKSADAFVGHARLRQGPRVNYLYDGSMRVGTATSTVTTAFTAFLDAPTAGFEGSLLAQDAIVFGSASTGAYAERIAALAKVREGGFETDLFDPASVDDAPPTGPIPHVLVGVPDSGINVYHDVYYRPNLTAHPCTYIEDFPCDIPALPFSVGVYDDFETAYAADAALWDSIEVGQWYWIPKTVFVAAMCEGTQSNTDQVNEAAGAEDKCLIDDSDSHGTGTTSSILTENPNALIAFKEGNAATTVFEDGTLPIDIVSYSWGAYVPLAVPGVVTRPRDYNAFFVAASGNEGAFPVVLDSTKASQAVINVGGADAATRTEPGYSSWKTADYVSAYCRPTAETKSVHEWAARHCGTSFAAPTVAGALSKIVLELRRESGYTGSIADGLVDPILGVSKWDVRDALNHSATYTPDARFPAETMGVPLVEAAPYYQWGWGYVDSTVVDEALACIREDACAERPDPTVRYMDALWTFRDVYGGWSVIDAEKCLGGTQPSCDRMPQLP